MTKPQRLNQWLLRRIKNNDAFGHPITLSYNDSSTHKSIFGGVVTLLARISLLVYFLIQITSVIQRQKCYITASTTYENLVNSQRIINLNKENFDFGVGIYRRPSYAYQLEHFEYISVQFSIVNYKMVDGIYTEQISIQDGVFCTDDRFLGDTDSIQNLGTTGTFICPPKDFQFKLKGSISSQDGHAYYIQIAPCNQSVLDVLFPGKNKTCKPQSEILNIINEFSVDIIYTQQYLNNNDFVQPIKPISRFVNAAFIINNRITNYLWIAATNVELHDSIFSSELNVQQEEFYQVDNFDIVTQKYDDPASTSLNIIITM